MRREEGGKGENGDIVPLMSAEQVLFALQQVGQGANGGLNRYAFTASYIDTLYYTTLHCAESDLFE
jgi:hypothetical protein